MTRVLDDRALECGRVAGSKDECEGTNGEWGVKGAAPPDHNPIPAVAECGRALEQHGQV